jgi:hypothetical protein
MSTYKMTIQGLEAYLNNQNDTLFRYLDLPAGIDKDTVIARTMAKAGEMPLLYTEPNYFKNQIRYWSKSYYRTFEKWINAVNAEYDPIYNYDRFEEWTDDHSDERTKNTSDLTKTNSTASGAGTSKSTREHEESGEDLLTRNTSDNRTVNLADNRTADLTDETERAAFNSGSYENYEQQSHTGTDNMSHTGTDNTAHGGTEKNENESGGSETIESEDSNVTTANGSSDRTIKDTDKGSGKDTHKGHLYGNIGVTTTMQMLKEEYDIALFSVYEHIADLFIKEFCLMIY